jgi:hypothetical protein
VFVEDTAFFMFQKLEFTAEKERLKALPTKSKGEND